MNDDGGDDDGNCDDFGHDGSTSTAFLFLGHSTVGG